MRGHQERRKDLRSVALRFSASLCVFHGTCKLFRSSALGGTSGPRSATGDVERTGTVLSPRHAKRQHEADDRVGEAIERQAFVHGLEALAKQGLCNEASRVERRILEQPDGRSPPVAGMRLPGETPSGPGQNGGRRQAAMFEAAGRRGGLKRSSGLGVTRSPWADKNALNRYAVEVAWMRRRPCGRV